MRVVPPREMIEYLDSIGASSSISSSSVKLKPSPPVVTGTPSGGHGGKSKGSGLLFSLFPGLATAFRALMKALKIILFGMGLFASDAQTSAQDYSGNPVAIDQPQPSGSATKQEEILIIPIRDDAILADQQATKSDAPATVNSPLAAEQPEATSVEDARILDADAKLREEIYNLQNADQADVPHRKGHTLSAPVELWPRQNNDQNRTLRPSWDTRISRSYRNWVNKNDDFTSTLLVLSCAGLLLLVGFYVYTERAMNRRVAEDKSCDQILDRKPLLPEPSEPTVVSHRLQHIAESDLISMRGNWKLGSYSTKGNVRSENQDFVADFELNNYQVLSIADGCGGVPYGAEASRIAVETCCTEIFRQLVIGKVSADLAIERGFAAASDALVSRGIELELTTLESGLRTTLIVAIGTATQFYWGYIGDGALRVISSTGDHFECMAAHRSNPLITNVLAASLGPTIHGKPSFGNKKRERGDVLIAGTDGVFDRVGDRFSRELMRMAVFYKGDLIQATRESVEQLAQVVDANSHSFICDDNLTLGLMMDGHQPDFLPEFWKTTNFPHSVKGATT